MSLLLVSIAVGSVWIVRGVRKRKPAETQATLPGNPPITPTSEPDLRGGEFKAPVANGVRRFAAPRGEEVTSVSAAPDGSVLAAVTAKHLYLFGPDLKPIPPIELPGLPPAGRQVVALASDRIAVWNTVPAAQTETRVLHVVVAPPGGDPKGPTHRIQEERIAGDVAFGAVVAGRLVLVARDPAAVAVFGRDGKLAGQHEIAANPQRIDVSADGTWAVVASAGEPGAGYAGVLSVDLSAAEPNTPAFAAVNTGPGVFRPVVALPVDDAVVVAGSAESDRPLAIVSPRAGGDLRARIPLGEGKVMGATRSASGKRVALFVSAPKGEKEIEARAIVLDPAAWSIQAELAAGPAHPSNRPIVLGERVVVAACHSAPILDLGAAAVDPGVTFPSPGDGPCLQGLWLVGDHLAAREGRQIVTWPAPK